LGDWSRDAKLKLAIASYRALCGDDGSRHSRCRFPVLQKPILGTADSEYCNRLGVRSVLLEIPEASMNKGRLQVIEESFTAQAILVLNRAIAYPPSISPG
jgi:hypothetical protein